VVRARCASADGIDEPLLAAEAGDLGKHVDEDSDDDTPLAHAAHAAGPPTGAAPSRNPLRRCVAFLDSQAGATVCSIWLCLILKVVQQARRPAAPCMHSIRVYRTSDCPWRGVWPTARRD